MEEAYLDQICLITVNLFSTVLPEDNYHAHNGDVRVRLCPVLFQPLYPGHEEIGV